MSWTYNWGVESYELGTAFGHLALEGKIFMPPVKLYVRQAKITREPGPVKGGTTVIAFVEDPDGCKIELISKKKDAGQA